MLTSGSRNCLLINPTLVPSWFQISELASNLSIQKHSSLLHIGANYIKVSFKELAAGKII
jgi:hypothetical protein